jgi:hypothetical protein
MDCIATRNRCPFFAASCKLIAIRMGAILHHARQSRSGVPWGALFGLAEWLRFSDKAGQALPLLMKPRIIRQFGIVAS